MKRLVGSMFAGLMMAGMVASAVFAQESGPPPAPRSPDELDQLVAPLALYPDPLIAEIMAAATFPDQIVLADRYVTQGMSADDIENQELDSSVKAMAHYPNVLKWLDDNLPWTTQLGQAFATQEGDVMDAVQRMRAKAQSLGNLQSTPQQTVVNDGGDIEIVPVNPEIIYVPEYDPGVIFYTPGIYCAFGIGLPVGLWWRHDWDWQHHNVIYWDRHHPRPPGWWARPPGQRHDFPSAHVWHPNEHHLAPFTQDRGYPRAVVPPRQPVRPAPFRSNPGHGPGAGPNHTPVIIHQSGPLHPAEPPIHAEGPPSRAVVPPSRAVVPPSRAVVPPSRAVIPPSHAVVPPTMSPQIPSRPVEQPPRVVTSPREAAPPAERALPAPSRAGGNMFGGIESSRQTQQSSSRGAESRGVAPRGTVNMGGSVSAPRGGGGNAGGSAPRGGGGGGIKH